MNHLNLSIRALPMQRLLPVRSLDELEHLVKESEVLTGAPGRTIWASTIPAMASACCWASEPAIVTGLMAPAAAVVLPTVFTEVSPVQYR